MSSTPTLEPAVARGSFMVNIAGWGHGKTADAERVPFAVVQQGLPVAFVRDVRDSPLLLMSGARPRAVDSGRLGWAKSRNFGQLILVVLRRPLGPDAARPPEGGVASMERAAGEAGTSGGGSGRGR